LQATGVETLTALPDEQLVPVAEGLQPVEAAETADTVDGEEE